MTDRQLSIEENMTCSICMDLYDDPLALPCMHSFCRRCIQGILASSMCLTCPECRKDTKLGKKGIEGLSRNFQLGGIVASYKENMKNAHGTNRSNSKLPVCGDHRAPCQLQCKNCRAPVCLKCVTGDQHIAHSLSIIDDTDDAVESGRGIYCESHRRHYRVYCQTCQSLVCIRCMTAKEHVKHRFITVDSAFEHQKELLEGRLKELETRQQFTRSKWKSYRDFSQKTQTDAQRQREQLTQYFSRLKALLEKRERELKAELDNRETRAIAECKRKIDVLQTSDKDINNSIDRIKQLLTEERLHLLKTNTSSLERQLTMNKEEVGNLSYMSSALADAALITCQFDKEVKAIRWEWQHVPDPSEVIEATAPPLRPVPQPRKSQSLTDGQYQEQQYRQQQQNQRHQPLVTHLEIGSPVQRGRHWKAGMEDGGPGHFGTIKQTTVDPHTYIVRWPNGNKGSYTYNPPWKEEVIPP